MSIISFRKMEKLPINRYNYVVRISIRLRPLEIYRQTLWPQSLQLWPRWEQGKQPPFRYLSRPRNQNGKRRVERLSQEQKSKKPTPSKRSFQFRQRL